MSIFFGSSGERVSILADLVHEVRVVLVRVIASCIQSPGFSVRSLECTNSCSGLSFLLIGASAVHAATYCLGLAGSQPSLIVFFRSLISRSFVILLSPFAGFGQVSVGVRQGVQVSRPHSRSSRLAVIRQGAKPTALAGRVEAVLVPSAWLGWARLHLLPKFPLCNPFDSESVPNMGSCHRFLASWLAHFADRLGCVHRFLPLLLCFRLWLTRASLRRLSRAADEPVLPEAVAAAKHHWPVSDQLPTSILPCVLLRWLCPEVDILSVTSMRVRAHCCSCALLESMNCPVTQFVVPERNPTSCDLLSHMSSPVPSSTSPFPCPLPQRARPDRAVRLERRGLCAPRDLDAAAQRVQTGESLFCECVVDCCLVCLRLESSSACENRMDKCTGVRDCWFCPRKACLLFFFFCGGFLTSLPLSGFIVECPRRAALLYSPPDVVACRLPVLQQLPSLPSLSFFPRSGLNLPFASCRCSRRRATSCTASSRPRAPRPSNSRARTPPPALAAPAPALVGLTLTLTSSSRSNPGSSGWGLQFFRSNDSTL